MLNPETDNKLSEVDKFRNFLLESAATASDNFPYLHNDMRDFQAGKSSIFYSGPFWGTEEVVAAIRTLTQGQWLSAGESVREFESLFSPIVAKKNSLMVNSGSSANLVLISAAKRYFNWTDGDEIIVSSVGFPTTIAPIIQNNLKCKFIDIEMGTLNLNLDLVEQSISKRTKAILLSPVLGNPPDIDRIFDICKRNSLIFLLDDCDSLGTTWKNQPLSHYAFASTNSFYSSHHICTGEGGMVSCDNPLFMKIAKSIAWWGRDCFCVGKSNLLTNGSCGERFKRWLPNYDGILDHRYVFTEVGYNLKPLDLQGAIGSVQIKKLDDIKIRRKRSYFEISQSILRHLNVTVPKSLPDADPSWFGVPIICNSKKQKEALVKHFENSKIQTRNCFAGNILLQPGYNHLDNHLAYPEANKVLDLVFFVGAAPQYTQAVYDYVDTVCKKASSLHLE